MPPGSVDEDDRPTTPWAAAVVVVADRRDLRLPRNAVPLGRKLILP